MTDRPRTDHGAEAHARGPLGQPDAARDGRQDQFKPNEQDASELLVHGANNAGARVPRAIDAVPFVGPLLSRLVPTNPGKAGMAAGLESDGLAGKPIHPGKGGTQGTNLYNLLIAPLLANRAVTDQTSGGGSVDADRNNDSDISTNMSISGEDVAMGGGDRFDGFASLPGMEAFVSGGGGRVVLPHADVPMAALGALSPPAFGDVATRRGEGVGVA